MSFQSIATKILFRYFDRKRDRYLNLPENVTVQRDIAYGECGVEHLLDVVKPKDAHAKLPVIVSIHGGAYVYGCKEVYQYYAANLAENGFAVINFNYRLAPKSRFPAQLEDINRVMFWMQEHGQAYGLDLNNVFVVGDSAGAQMASHYLAIWSNKDFAKLFPFELPRKLRIRAAAFNCGIYQINLSNRLFRDYLEKNIAPNDPRLDVQSHISTAFPPVFVMTSWYDFLREEAKPMQEYLEAEGVPSVYRLYGREEEKYMGHVFHCNMNLEQAKQCNKDECDFFKNYMVHE